MKTDLSIRIGELHLKNPVMVASGTFGFGEEFLDFFDLRKLGAIITKTITLEPREGNPSRRTCETPSGLINSIGLENPGLDKFLEEKLPKLKKLKIPIIVSIASNKKEEEFLEITEELEKIKDIPAIELNISCPNVKNNNSFIIAHQPKATYNLVRKVRKLTSKTLITKLSPNVGDITEIALACEEAGTDAVSLVNTFLAMSVDIEKRKPKLSTITGGLSGPAIRPIAVRMVWQVYQKIKLPIIGMGGIIDISSALEFFIVGATAIAIGTANFINPRVTVEIIDDLRDYMIRNGLKNMKELIGSLRDE